MMMSVNVFGFSQSSRKWQRYCITLVRFWIWVVCAWGQISYAQIDSELNELMHDFSEATDFQKLEVINEYFNQLKFEPDHAVWGQEDYWATPKEFLRARAGDCEDFSMAKYYALRQMGLNEHQIRLAYVRVEPEGRAHMVLAYYPKEDGEPKILDNLTDAILRVSQRPDLVPAYSFNAEEVWIGLPHENSNGIGDAQRLRQWQHWLQRVGLSHSSRGATGGENKRKEASLF